MTKNEMQLEILRLQGLLVNQNEEIVKMSQKLKAARKKLKNK